MATRNAEIVLQYSTLYPFRLHGKNLMCVYCCDEIEDPYKYRCHMDETHKTVNVYAAFAHIKRGSEDRIYLKVDCTNLKCRLCEEPFDTVDEIAQHLTDHDNKDIDDIDLNYDVGLQPYRLNKDKLFCLLCNMKQPTLTKLVSHTSSHYADYSCDKCNKTFLTMANLKSHLKFTHSEKHICWKCKIEFPTAEERKLHLKTSSRCWGFCCTYCNERFSCYENREKHLVSEHNAQPKTYPCSDCGVVFDSRVNFYYHYNKMHSDLAHMCSVCGQKFGNKRMFDEHVFVVHSGIKQFQCTCLKFYSRKRHLLKHMRKCTAAKK